MGKEPQANTVEITKGQMDPEAVWTLQVCTHCQYSWAFTQRGVAFFFFHFFMCTVCMYVGAHTCGVRPMKELILNQAALFGSCATLISNVSELQEYGAKNS